MLKILASTLPSYTRSVEVNFSHKKHRKHDSSLSILGEGGIQTLDLPLKEIDL
jgi:hypothetical protein